MHKGYFFVLLTTLHHIYTRTHTANRKTRCECRKINRKTTTRNTKSIYISAHEVHDNLQNSKEHPNESLWALSSRLLAVFFFKTANKNKINARTFLCYLHKYSIMNGNVASHKQNQPFEINEKLEK